MKFNSSKKQKAYTLIEMMVALFIGLGLLAGLMQVFLASKQSYSLGEGMSRLQENGRIANYGINRFVRLAGYKTNPVLRDKNVFTESSELYPGYKLYPSQVVSGADNYSGSKNIKTGTDVFSVRYQDSPDSVMTDCLGAGIGSRNEFINTWFVRENQLYCQVGGATQPLISGVEDLQVLYGIDSDTDFVVDQYLPASDQGAVSWNQVIAIRYALLANTVNNVATTDDNKNYQLLTVGPETVAGSSVASMDKKRRRIFSSLVQLRNKTP